MDAPAHRKVQPCAGHFPAMRGRKQDKGPRFIPMRRGCILGRGLRPASHSCPVGSHKKDGVRYKFSAAEEAAMPKDCRCSSSSWAQSWSSRSGFPAKSSVQAVACQDCCGRKTTSWKSLEVIPEYKSTLMVTWPSQPGCLVFSLPRRRPISVSLRVAESSHVKSGGVQMMRALPLQGQNFAQSSAYSVQNRNLWMKP